MSLKSEFDSMFINGLSINYLKGYSNSILKWLESAPYCSGVFVTPAGASTPIVGTISASSSLPDIYFASFNQFVNTILSDVSSILLLNTKVNNQFVLSSIVKSTYDGPGVLDPSDDTLEKVSLKLSTLFLSEISKWKFNVNQLGAPGSGMMTLVLTN